MLPKNVASFMSVASCWPRPRPDIGMRWKAKRSTAPSEETKRVPSYQGWPIQSINFSGWVGAGGGGGRGVLTLDEKADFKNRLNTMGPLLIAAMKQK